MKQIASSPVEITVDFLRQESLELFRFWGESGQKAY